MKRNKFELRQAQLFEQSLLCAYLVKMKKLFFEGLFFALLCFIQISKQCFYIEPENASTSEQANVTAYKIVENVESNIRCALLCKTAANGICKSVKLVVGEKKCFLYKELMNGKKIHVRIKTKYLLHCLSSS